ncbi:MAG: phosphoribosylamine--glycine ligase [Acidobacteriota bacterium]|jgi:phosphoribosylamine--glycine ligase|nr:phosphoribosylamine--glycine ligase [Acidobacteriota bacterium]
MKILIIGSGGREHTMAWKLRRSPKVTEVICVPGNGGMAGLARCVAANTEDFKAIAELARKERVDYVLVGPEAPLAAGVVDHLKAAGIKTLGPTRAAALLESSKVFAKDFMTRHNIPTAGYKDFHDAEAAMEHLRSTKTEYPLVVKADGLAAGKGVVVAKSAGEALDAVKRIMIDREFGDAGDRLIIEDCLQGIEASYIVFTDGKTVLPAAAARDHKAIFDNDEGPNTGGMGTYSSDDILGGELEKEVMSRVIQPVIDGMRAEGAPFQGILYAGLMLTAKGIMVLEFNVRMGDPECQVILPRLESDFAELAASLCEERLADYKAVWRPGAAVCVVLASKGYPGPYEKGKEITGIETAEEDPQAAVFHAGTSRKGDAVFTDGGRVLGVTAVDGDLASAIKRAYAAVDKIHFDGMIFRRDIGAKGLRKH